MDVRTQQCRMCLTECDDDKLESMLTSWNDSINLWTMYDYIMNVGESENVPHICKNCKKELNSAYLFKVMCTETERTLSELVKIPQTDNETETEYVECDSEDNVEQYADDYLDDNIEICQDIESEEVVVEGSEEECEDSSENIVETVVDVLEDTKDDLTDESVTKCNTGHEFHGERNTSTLFSRKCKSCDTQFESIQAYRVHRQLHQRAHNRKLHKSSARKCPTCNIQFKNVKLYQAHYRRFHKGSVVKQVDKDAQTSSAQSKVLCSYCGRLFSKSFIGKHLQSKHSGDTKKEYECTTCGKSFSLSENLKMHKRIHTNDKRFICDVCGEKFLHWATRRNHIRSKHTGEKNYECHLCGRKFTHNSNMYRHIRRHKNELPHSCSSCDKRFLTKEELKNHQIVHTKVKNESCEICFKCFGTQKNLKAHMRTHSERNYVCTVCDKRFTQPHVLRTHLNTHPGVPMPQRGVILSQKSLGRIERESKFVEFEN